MITPHELRASLREHFAQCSKYFFDLIAAADKLSPLFEYDASKVSAVDILDRGFVVWLSTLLEKISEANRGAGGLSLEVSDVPPAFRSLYESDYRAFRSDLIDARHGNPRENISQTLARFLEAYDFPGLSAWLSTRAANLEQQGFVTAATQIGEFFSFFDRGGEQNAIALRANGDVIVKKSVYPSSFGYDWNWIQRIHSTANWLRIMEPEAGVSGLALGLDHIAGKLRQANSQLPTRTEFDAGGAIRATLFKGAIEFRITKSHVEPMLAFIALHSGKPLKTLGPVRKATANA